TNHLIFSSFDFNVLNIIKEYYMPEANIGILYKNKTDPWLDQAKALNAQTINPPHKLITPDLIRAIKNENYDIMTWTVNHYETAQNLYGLGVDAIITDYPNRLALLIKS
ncbi:MAG: hypothetical protein HAW67_03205, partial [Endozoicomonadaceae bacterium]|nr:hypothetical protein [Endozoicomonadaceae bacterium]